LRLIWDKQSRQYLLVPTVKDERKGSVFIKRKRVASSKIRSGQHSTHHAEHTTASKGLELWQLQGRAKFIEHGPTVKIMAMIADMIKERVQNETASTS
jgi:hypothetical protein